MTMRLRPAAAAADGIWLRRRMSSGGFYFGSGPRSPLRGALQSLGVTAVPSPTWSSVGSPPLRHALS